MAAIIRPFYSFLRYHVGHKSITQNVPPSFLHHQWARETTTVFALIPILPFTTKQTQVKKLDHSLPQGPTRPQEVEFVLRRYTNPSNHSIQRPDLEASLTPPSLPSRNLRM